MSDIIELLITLIKNMSVVIVLAYVLTRTRVFSAIMKKQAVNWQQQAWLIITFGVFSIFGTLSGININGAIANIRDLGPAIAGLFGGPLAGIGAGLIGGIHRYSMGGITAFPCAVSTILAGLTGGLIHYFRKGELVSIKGAVIFMALFEAFHMGLNLLMVRPFEQIWAIIQSVSLPMILTNALGMGIFVFIIHNLVREKETQRQKEMIEGELTVAREIQMSIVPKIFPAFPERKEFDIYAVLEPAKEVGGDLYDYFLLDDDHLCFTIGDVSGKGVPASLFMAVTKTLIKAKADIKLKPDEILFRVNNELCEDNDSGMFVTQFLGILTISTGEIEYSNGGHNLPYILRRDGSLVQLPRIAGMALGVVENIPYNCTSLKLAPGDSLVMYTDGVTEAMNEAGELFTEKRLERMLAGLTNCSAREEVELILHAAFEFACGATQSDDITIVVLQFTGGRSMEFRLKNDLQEIRLLAEAVAFFGEKNQLPEKLIFQVNLVLDELLTNTISYGFPDGGEHELLVRFKLQDGKFLLIEVKDDGVPFNPLQHEEPDLNKDIDERPIGGLGIHLVRNMVDEIQYRFKDEHNILSMKKYMNFS